MAPILTLFGHEVHSYPLMTLLAALLGAALAWPALGRAGWPRRERGIALLCMALAFLVGARLWNVAVTPASYGPDRPWYTLRLTGLSLFGGILGAFLALLGAVRVTRWELWDALDAFTLPSGAAFCVARVGCFLNGCCKGVPTDLPWGVTFRSILGEVNLGSLGVVNFNPAAHPTQLYELFGAALGIPLALWAVKRFRLPAGGRFLTYGVWFCFVRLAILPLRALIYPVWVKWGVYPTLYALLIAGGVWMLRRSRRSGSV